MNAMGKLFVALAKGAKGYVDGSLERISGRVTSLEDRPAPRDGIAGADGRPGRDGRDGRHISKMWTDDDGVLCVVYSDGTETEIGRVMGPQGEKGEAGVPGDRGPIGGEGDRGPEGMPGPRGIQGVAGERGLPGPRGHKGDRGERGSDGKDGEAGFILALGESELAGVTSRNLEKIVSREFILVDGSRLRVLVLD